jgi:hypothetical protein
MAGSVRRFQSPHRPLLEAPISVLLNPSSGLYVRLWDDARIRPYSPEPPLAFLKVTAMPPVARRLGASWEGYTPVPIGTPDRDAGLFQDAPDGDTIPDDLIVVGMGFAADHGRA